MMEEREEVWYLEYFDVNFKDWTGLPPYREYLSAVSARAGYDQHKKEVPGGRARAIHETRVRTVAFGG